MLGTTHLTVFTGPMFSSKSDALLTAIKRHEYAQQRVKVAKPFKDDRTPGYIASRQLVNGESQIREQYDATIIRGIDDFRAFTAGEDYDVLAIDEAQFFPLDEPYQDCLGWFGRGIRDLLFSRRKTPLYIFIAGLDTTSNDMPFGPMPGLLALADRVEKLTAVCMCCSRAEGTKSQIRVQKSEEIQVGDIETYEARCRRCFEPM